MKGAFDNLYREEIWKRMKEGEVDEQLRTRIEDIYRETTGAVRISGEIIGKFRTKRGVRQSCPLSPTLFNVAFSDLEKELAIVQEGSVVIGRRKIRSVKYADDVSLMATAAAGLRDLMKKFRGYIRRKSLELRK